MQNICNINLKIFLIFFRLQVKTLLILDRDIFPFSKVIRKSVGENRYLICGDLMEACVAYAKAETNLANGYMVLPGTNKVAKM